jgi:hypothetical protein
LPPVQSNLSSMDSSLAFSPILCSAVAMVGVYCRQELQLSTLRPRSAGREEKRRLEHVLRPVPATCFAGVAHRSGRSRAIGISDVTVVVKINNCTCVKR